MKTLNKVDIEQPFEPVFDESFLHAARFEDETYEAYKIRQKENYKFWKFYKKFGSAAVLQFKKFLEQLQKDEEQKAKQEAVPPLTPPEDEQVQ